MICPHCNKETQMLVSGTFGRRCPECRPPVPVAGLMDVQEWASKEINHPEVLLFGSEREASDFCENHIKPRMTQGEAMRWANDFGMPVGEMDFSMFPLVAGSDGQCAFGCATDHPCTQRGTYRSKKSQWLFWCDEHAADFRATEVERISDEGQPEPVLRWKHEPNEPYCSCDFPSIWTAFPHECGNCGKLLPNAEVTDAKHSVD